MRLKLLEVRNKQKTADFTVAEYNCLQTLSRRRFSNWTYLENSGKKNRKQQTKKQKQQQTQQPVKIKGFVDHWLASHWMFSLFAKVILLGSLRKTTKRKDGLDLLHNNFTQNFTLLAADISSSVSSPLPKRKCLPHLPVFRHGIFRLSFFCLPSLSLMSSSFLGFWPFLPWTMSPNSISFASLEV